MKVLHLPHIKKIEMLVQKTVGAISFAQGALRVGGVPQKAREYVASLLSTDQADYYGPASGIESLKQAIVDSYKEKNAQLTNQNILISHGSIGAFSVLCGKMLTAGDHVLLPVPNYPVYYNVIKSFDAEPICSQSYLFENGEWRLDLGLLESAITSKTKMLLISNPSNPLGLLLTKEMLTKLIALAEKNDLLLVIDEAYDAFIFEATWESSVSYLFQSKQLVRLGSFSKNASMSGWRIGYLMADQSLVSSLIPVQDAFFCCPSMVGQFLAEFMVKYPELMITSQIRVVEAKNRVVAFFESYKMTEEIQFQVPQGGFYLFIKWGDKNADEWVFDLLEKKGVGLVPGSDFSEGHQQWARLCFARTLENVDEGLRRMAEYFEEQRQIAFFHNSVKQTEI